MFNRVVQWSGIFECDSGHCQEPAGPPPPPGFKKYEQSSGAGGVMGMIEQVIADAKYLVADKNCVDVFVQSCWMAIVLLHIDYMYQDMSLE